MRFEMFKQYEHEKGCEVLYVKLEISMHEFQRCLISGSYGHNMGLLRECEESEKVSDKLLGLEHIARLIEKQREDLNGV